MFKAKHFSIALRRAISERFGNGKPFTSQTFVKFAESYGKRPQAIKDILRRMQEKDQIQVVGETTNKNGGSPIKRYVVIPGKPVKLKSCPDYEIEAMQRQQNMERAALALQGVLDKIARNRQAA